MFSGKSDANASYTSPRRVHNSPERDSSGMYSPGFPLKSHPSLHLQSDIRNLYPEIRPMRAELNWLHVIHAEIVSVTAAMRKNQRWSIDREQIKDDAAMPRYDYWEDTTRHGRAALDSVIDFATQTGYNGVVGDAAAENPLLQNFLILKARLTLLRELRDLDPMHLIDPFLEVIRSGDTTGPITGAALSSIEKFINYRVLDPHHPGLPAAMSALTHSVTRCKFEATDAVSDEVVLSRILRLLRVTVTSEAGQRNLDDKGICEMVEVAFGMFFQGRVSELLRKAAEETLIVLVQALFERLTIIIRTKEHEALLRESLQAQSSKSNNDAPQPTSPTKPDHRRRLSASLRAHSEANGVESYDEGPIQSPSISVDSGMAGQQTHEGGVISVGSDINEDVSASDDGLRIGYTSNDGIVPETVRSVRHEDGGSADVQPPKEQTTGDPAVPEEEAALAPGHSDSTSHSPIQSHRPFHPYGLPAILEMIRVLTTLVDPRNRNHTDSMHRTIALKLLHAAVEVGGRSLGRWIGWGIDVELERRERKVQGPGKHDAGTDVKIVTDAGKSVVNAGGEKTAVPSGDERKPTVAEGEKLNGTITPSRSGAETPVGSGSSIVGKNSEDEEVYENDEERMAVAVKSLVLNDLCKYLFQLFQTSNMTLQMPPNATGLAIITLTLRVVTSLLQTAREHLKLQQEWFLNWVMARVNSDVAVWDIEEWHQGAGEVREVKQQQKGGIVVGEVRELLLESLVQLSRMPTFMTNLYVNYDGNNDSQSHMFEEFMHFAAKHSFPDATPGGPVTTLTHQNLCLDILLMFLNTLVERKSAIKGVGRYGEPAPLSITQMGETSGNADLPKPDTLSHSKQRKRVLKEGADRFNEKPKLGIQFLQEHDFLPDPIDPHSLATLLKSTPNFNKTLLGDYLSRPDQIDLLKAFVKNMDFAGGKRIDEALRLLLESFRLPGESQQIARIMEVFAETYFAVIAEEEGHELADQDSAYVLSYSIIMLNTDQHNPQVRRRMTLEDFTRNNRGMNGGKDFSPDYLKQIYQTIKHNEIVMPEEHEGDLGFNYQWKELMKRADKAGSLVECRTSVFDKDMFLLVWSPLLAALTYAFDNAEDDLTLQKAVVGFHHMGAIAAHYRLVEVLDTVVVTLSRMTGLLREMAWERDPAVDENGKKIGVDQWVVEFGRTWRGQVAAVLMFGMVREWGGVVKAGWVHVMDTIRNLFMHSFLPQSMLEAEDFIRRTIPIPKIPSRSAAKVSNNAAARREAGLFSTLSHFLSLSSPNSIDEFANAEPTEEEVRAESIGSECVRACKIEELLRDSRLVELARRLFILLDAHNHVLQTRFLEADALQHVMRTILQASFETPASKRSMERNLEEGPTRSTTPRLPQSPSRTLQDVRSQPSPIPEEPSSTDATPAATPATPAAATYNAAAVFMLEVAINVALQNRDRVGIVWDILVGHVKDILGAGGVHVMLVERAVVGLLRVCMRLVHKDDLTTQVFNSLDLLTHLPPDTFTAIAERLMAGVLALIKTDSSVFVKHAKWDTVLTLLSSTSMHPQAARYSFEAASILVTESKESVVTAENFDQCVDLLIGYAAGAGVVGGGGGEGGSLGGESPRVGKKAVGGKGRPPQAIVERAVKALDKLYRLHSKIPRLVEESGIKPNRAFFEFWLPILSGLSQQSYHPAREVRQHALTHLQRALLSPELESTSSSPETWADVFENVLFPLLDELLKTDVGNLDPSGMDETRMRASALLCKIFLQYLPRLVKGGPQVVVPVWGRVLEYVRRYLGTGGTDYVYEGVLESLKNMLLVMTTQGVFQPGDQTSGGVNLWNVTWQQIDPFLPTLKEELFPPVPPEAAAPTAPAEVKKPPEQAQSVSHSVAGEGKPEAVAPVAPVLETLVEGGSVITQQEGGEEVKQ
ncbi:GDP/GTP exchange factor for ARF [Rhizophlyctis rosea]|nr:GDP/GTP exchange factor for ARF [Rhizophlyctis rosea]